MSFTSWLRNVNSASKQPRSVRADRRRRPVVLPLRMELLEDRLCPSSLPVGGPLVPPDAATQARVAKAYGQLPLSFEANQGQTDAQVNFVSRGSGYALFLTPAEAVLALNQGSGVSGQGSESDVLHMQLVGANAAPQTVGLGALPGRSNYLIGNDPSQWQTDVPSYSRVAYQNVYSGVDLVYYGNQRQLEYDFIVAPGADPHAIKLAFQGAKGMAIDAQGNLILHSAGGDVIEHAPVLYQESAGHREAVSGRYVIDANGQVGFAIGAYDQSRQLVIDPVSSLVYSTYLGGNAFDFGVAIAVDASGDAYVTGYTGSTTFPTKNPLQMKLAGSSDVFVTKLNAAGSALVYSTYLGGSGTEKGLGIAVSGGNAYLTGWTTSTNFPTKNAFQAKYGGGSTDAFVTVLNASGSALVYSTYLGGSGGEKSPNGHGGIAVDGAGNAYVTGTTYSANFPVTPGAFQTTAPGGGDTFVTKINPSLVGKASLVYSTYFGGSSRDYAYGIAVDSAGDAYVTGESSSDLSNDFPITPGAFQTTGHGAFVTKFNPTGTALVYSTWLGYISSGLGIALNRYGNAYVTGVVTGVGAIPTTPGAYQTTLNGRTNAFVTEFNLDGSALVYSTYLGGSDYDFAQAIAVDGAGNAYVTGRTRSTNFPTANAFQPKSGSVGDYNAFVAEINPTQVGAASLVYSSYLGYQSAAAYGIAVDGGGNAYVTGSFYASFPTTTGAFQTKTDVNNGESAFVTKISPPAAATSVSANSPLAGVAGGTKTQLAPETVAAFFVVPANPVSLATGFFGSAPRDEFVWQPASWSAPLSTREVVSPIPAPAVGHPAKAARVRIEVVDLVFAHADWLQDLPAANVAMPALD